MRFLYLTSIFFFLASTILAQEPIKCFTTEHEQELQNRIENRADAEAFEKWMSEKLEKASAKSDRGLVVLPVVFHVMHSGEAVGSGNNVSTALINAQLQQLNDDFRRTPGTAGFNSNPVGADLEIEFCMATVDPDGNILAEPGIDRVNAPAIGLNSPGYSTNYMDNNVKPATIWNPDEYINVWVTPINIFFFSVLGYAQFPSLTGLPGLNNNEGAASTDGVVVSPETVGSVSLPNPQGGATGRGRTLTHELGHFFGLRHIWGDGGCSVDDFCADTPQSDAANYGCATGTVSCSSADMVENYMDYSDDLCMNIFTQDQKARVDVVLANSPRRASLLNSSACGSDEVPCSNPYPAVSDLNATNSGNGILLSWEPIQGSIGCQIRAGLVSSGSFAQTVTVFGSEASEFFVPGGAIQSGVDYQWQVRCGCSTSPLIVGPWSSTGTFSLGSSSILSSTTSALDSEFTIYPNPAEDEVFLNVGGAEQIQVFDISGRLVDSRILDDQSRVQISLDVSNWTKGVYFLSASYPDGQMQRQKLIVE